MTQKKKLGNWHNRFSLKPMNVNITRGHLASPSLSQKFTYFLTFRSLFSYHAYTMMTDPFECFSFVLAIRFPIFVFFKHAISDYTLSCCRNSSFLGGSLQSLIYIYIHTYIWYGRRVFDFMPIVVIFFLQSWEENDAVAFSSVCQGDPSMHVAGTLDQNLCLIVQ